MALRVIASVVGLGVAAVAVWQASYHSRTAVLECPRGGSCQAYDLGVSWTGEVTIALVATALVVLGLAAWWMRHRVRWPLIPVAVGMGLSIWTLVVLGPDDLSALAPA